MPPQQNMFSLLQAFSDPSSFQYPFRVMVSKRPVMMKANQKGTVMHKIDVTDPNQQGPSVTMILLEKPGVDFAPTRDSLVEGAIVNVTKLSKGSSTSKVYVLASFTVEPTATTSTTTNPPPRSSIPNQAVQSSNNSNNSRNTTSGVIGNNTNHMANQSSSASVPTSASGFQRPMNQASSNLQQNTASRPPSNQFNRPPSGQQVPPMNNLQQQSRPSSLIPQQQQPQKSSFTPTTNNQNIDLRSKAIVPLIALTPWLNDWVIKARVTRKPDLKHWTKDDRKGTILSINLIDQDSTEIRATFFNEGAIKANSKLRERGVYYFKGGKIKPADHKFNTRIAHNYEITFYDNCIIQEATDNESVCIPQGRFSLTPLDQVKDSTSQDKFDIIGIVKKIGDTTEFKSKNENSNATLKRDVTILSKDSYGKIVEAAITLWGDTIKFEEKSVVIFTGVGRKLSDNGMSLSCNSSQCIVDVDIPEAAELHQLFSALPIEEMQGEVITAVFTKSSTFRKVTIQDVANTTVEELDKIKPKDKDPGKTKIFFIRSHVILKQDDFTYPACSNPDCKGKKMKKDADQMDPTLRCPSCGGVEMSYRYMTSVVLADYSSSIYVTAFDSAITALLDRSAYDFATSDENTRREIVSDMQFECASYRIRASMPQQGDKVRFTLMGMKKIENWDKEAKSSLSAIKAYMNTFGLK
ncbi:hypothetical protein FDP41_004932 [Naegleria fowleri]|uniref:Replication protein A subunit n=1 Tax=Naegleria fowleri TaxID=5763 RepID=A0A6A5BH77_NAEFO|nr:uncharacterized protein FDP41_004932 [Naegleria fowleri]KAF0976257.1 hypothetical protein FDP41_004932 [Naegleria fowleri]CAG4716409.1 unnamed protein product [Naegleria fowleri]